MLLENSNYQDNAFNKVVIKILLLENSKYQDFAVRELKKLGYCF